jgi:hypothetical protein
MQKLVKFSSILYLIFAKSLSEKFRNNFVAKFRDI